MLIETSVIIILAPIFGIDVDMIGLHDRVED